MPITSIDCHIHTEPEMAEYLIHAMDEANTKKAILLGSSKFTFTLNPQDGFTQYQENNSQLLAVRRKYPDRFEVWPTLDPLADNKCELLEGYLGEGASGLKLYIGHGYSHGNPSSYMFHTTPINSERMMDVYQLCQDRGVPICMHVNTTDNAPGFREEFESVLTLFPKLKILAPHWMLATRRPAYLRKMLEKHANLWTDTSFGQDDTLIAGMTRLADKKDIFLAMINDFSDRILCGSDIVCTRADFKTIDWMAKRISAYKNMLAERNYVCPVTGELRNGFALPEDILTRLLSENALRLIAQ